MTYSYSTLKTMLGSESTKKIALHTNIVPNKDGSLSIYVGSIINTSLVTFLSDGQIRINAGGFRGSNVRELINKYIPFFSIIAHEGFWFWTEKGQEKNLDKPIALFTDGDTIHEDGRLDFQRNAGDALKMLQYRSKIRGYAELYSKNAPLNQPNSTDCWHCFIQRYGNTPLGEGDSTHIREHIDKMEIVPSLLRNANTTNSSGSSSYISQSAFKKHGKSASSVNKETQKAISGVIEKYLFKALGLPTTIKV